MKPALNEPGSYKYGELEEGFIRILQLQPNLNSEEQLTFDLVDVCFNGIEGQERSRTPIKYIAVSYTWGEPKFRHQAFCDNCPIQITDTCRDILTVLRRRDAVVNIWIDQVCINQASPEDSAENISRMGEIYEKATAVFIWTQAWGSEMEEHLASYSRPPLLWGAKLLSGFLVELFGGAESPETLPHYRSPEERDEILSTRFVCQDWFYRLWTLQETILTLPDRLYFVIGRLLIHFGRLAISSIGTSATLYEKLNPLLEAQVALSRRHVLPECPMTYQCSGSSLSTTIFSTLFAEVRIRECSIESDIVFAVQAALQAGFSSYDVLSRVGHAETMLKPDYKLPIETLLTRTAAYILGNQKELEFLTLAILSKQEQTEVNPSCAIPSWVPDLLRLSVLSRSRGDEHSWPLHSIRFCLNFAGFLPSKMRLATHCSLDARRDALDAVLTLTGCLQGQIKHVSAEISGVDSEPWARNPKRFLHWRRHIYTLLLDWYKSVRAESMPNAFVSDLGAAIRYRDRSKRISHKDAEISYIYEILRRLTNMDDQQSELQDMVRIKRSTRKRLRLMKGMDFEMDMAYFEKCSFVLSERSSISETPDSRTHGIAFGDVKEGDYIIAIDGLDDGTLTYRKDVQDKVPQWSEAKGTLTRLILRPVNDESNAHDSEQRWKLVGKAILPRLVIEPPSSECRTFDLV